MMMVILPFIQVYLTWDSESALDVELKMIVWLDFLHENSFNVIGKIQLSRRINSSRNKHDDCKYIVCKLRAIKEFFINLKFNLFCASLTNLVFEVQLILRFLFLYMVWSPIYFVLLQLFLKFNCFAFIDCLILGLLIVLLNWGITYG